MSTAFTYDTWGMDADTPVIMVDIVNTVVMPGLNTHTETHIVLKKNKKKLKIYLYYTLMQC